MKKKKFKIKARLPVIISAVTSSAALAAAAAAIIYRKAYCDLFKAVRENRVKTFDLTPIFEDTKIMTPRRKQDYYPMLSDIPTPDREIDDRIIEVLENVNKHGDLFKAIDIPNDDDDDENNDELCEIEML